MKQINISRDGSGNVTFETVSIDVTENVFFTNLDPESEHWPTLASNQLGPFPSPNSSESVVAAPQTGTTVTYGCKIAGHEKERGVIEVFPQLAADAVTLAPAVRDKQIAKQRVVKGGKPPYAISGQLFQIADGGSVIQQGSGSIGPGLQLTQDANGIYVSGVPAVSGTYNFTFTVDDAMGRNLQQVQYSMAVTRQ